jgi:hypothetical protein
MKSIFGLNLVSGEHILKSEPAYLVSENNSRTGRLVLTTFRLLWGEDTSHEAVYNIDLDTINKIERKSLLVDENILALTYLQYQEVRFSVTDYESWEEVIEATRMTPNI